MFSRITTLQEKKFAGKKIKMSFSQNKTIELWQSFMPLSKEIQNVIGSELYSIEVYDKFFFNNFDSNNEFEKWAAIEVKGFDELTANFESIILPTGLYAVFLHKGAASEALKTYEYIFKTWLPKSNFILDDRPHLAVMDEKYKKDDLNSEEEIWIPIKRS